jgi:uncharacterized membrane protein YkvA (DUF1232 family)
VCAIAGISIEWPPVRMFATDNINISGREMAEYKNTTSGNGSRGAARPLDSMDDREEADVTQEEIDSLGRSLPKKMKGVEDLREGLKEGMDWLTEMLDRVKLIFQMVTDKGFALEGKAKVLIVGALLYFILPMDLTPDFIPGIGYLDDALVLSGLWKTIEGQIDRYTSFRRTGIASSSKPEVVTE